MSMMNLTSSTFQNSSLRPQESFPLIPWYRRRPGWKPLRSGCTDAVVSDFQMPGMDGIEFLKAVRSKFGSIPFILFTGRGREEVVIEAINNGTDFYIQKGGDPRAQFAELAHQIRQAVARRTAERSRIESEKRLSDIINFLPDATFAIDRAGTVIAWNRAIEEMTGVAAQVMLGKGNYEYAVPFYGERRPILIDLIFSSPEEIQAHYSQIVQDGTMLAAETALPRVHGEIRTLWGKASPLYDKNGQIAGFDRVHPGHHRAEKSRRYSGGTVPASCRERVPVKAVGSGGACRPLGIPPRHRENDGFRECRCDLRGGRHRESDPCDPENPPPQYRQALDDALNGLVKRGKPYDLDFRIRRPSDGALRDIYSTATYDPEKRVVFGIIHDITERKKTESELAAANEQLTAAQEELQGQDHSLAANQKALAASEEKYRAILENIQDVYYRTDKQGTLVMISPSGADLFGCAGVNEMTGEAGHGLLCGSGAAGRSSCHPE